MPKPDDIRETFLTYQKNEITEYHIYRKLAKLGYSPENKRILETIASDELRHYDAWKRFTKKDVDPDTFRIWKYYTIARLFGFTFAIKLLERVEEDAQVNCARIREVVDDADEEAMENPARYIIRASPSLRSA